VLCKDGLLYSKHGYPTDPFAPNQQYVNLSLYGVNIKSLLNNETVKVPDDQVGNPTLSSELANVSVLLAQRDRDGIFNVAGTGRVSRYEFAREAAYVFGLDESLIEPVKTESLAQAAKRPLNAGLVMDKVLDIHQGRISDYKAGLKTLQRKLAP